MTDRSIAISSPSFSPAAAQPPSAQPPSIPHAAAPSTAVQNPGAARRRLLLEGPIVSTLLRLAVPNVVVNVVLIAVTATVDAYFVGLLDPNALAGLSLVFPLLMLMQQVANSSMGGAIASSVARAIGSKRHEDASALVVHGLVIACAMAAVFASVVLIAGPTFYALMGGTGATLAAAVEYSNAIFAGALAYWLLSTLTSVVRGAGQAAVLAVVYIAAEILHILLVPTLVFGIGPIPALGITGAGIATAASFSASTLVLAWYLASGRLVLVLYPLTFGLGAGLLAMVGTNIGAGQPARAARITWIATALATGVTGGIGVFGVMWPEAWVGFFSVTPAIHLAAASYL